MYYYIYMLIIKFIFPRYNCIGPTIERVLVCDDPLLSHKTIFCHKNVPMTVFDRHPIHHISVVTKNKILTVQLFLSPKVVSWMMLLVLS